MNAGRAPTVLIGLGATKAGSSWLYERLAAHPECHFRTIKELQYFPTAISGKWDREIASYMEAHKALAERLARKFGKHDPKIPGGEDLRSDKLRRLHDRAEWIALLEKRRYDPEGYISYLTRHAGAARVVGDITPAYSLLSEEWLERILKLSGDVKMIYVVRDPLDRLWSHVRMIAARRDPSGKATIERAHNILRRTLRGKEDQIAIRSDYSTILPKLVSVVPHEKLRIETFEDVVTGRAFPEICQFLGISSVPVDTTPVYASQQVSLSAEARALALEWLRPQYDAALAHFGVLPETWNTP